MAAPTTTWAVTEIEHPALRGVRENCVECLDLADRAITHATVTGSKGATMVLEPSAGRPRHSATVARAVAVLTR